MFTQIKLVAIRVMPIALAVLLIGPFLPDAPVAITGPALKTPVGSFERVATYDVPGQVAEIVASTPDGETLIYTASASEEIGFVTIAEPRHPTNGGSLKMPGEPTSVAITPDGAWALVAVHGSSQKALVVVNLATRTLHTTIVLGGQPDSVAISADGRYAAISWTPGGRLVTANEGDYDLDLSEGEFSGGRDFTVFSETGAVLLEPGAALELQAVRHGHYPDDRSENRGIETEGVAVGVYDQAMFLFVGAERGNFVAVYRLDDETNPEFVQILPTGIGPEGLLLIPQRGLFVTANEEDGTISIFQGMSGHAPGSYPQVVSDGLPWSALSGLAAGHGNTVYAVPDNAFSPSRIWTLRLEHVAQVTSARTVTKDGEPASYDLEGVAVRPQGGWWLVSEGAEDFGAVELTKNLLIRVNADGSVAEEIELSDAVNRQQRSNGFEGVTTDADGSQVYVAFQREWADDPMDFVKIGRYTPATQQWAFFHYPLDSLEAPPAGGWVGLSEITWIGDDTFLVVERDNQRRDDAQVKRLYSVSVAGITPAIAGHTPPVLDKSLVRDLLVQDDYRLEKIEGVALTKSGALLVVNDNDGAGETRLLRLRGVISRPPSQ